MHQRAHNEGLEINYYLKTPLFSDFMRFKESHSHMDGRLSLKKGLEQILFGSEPLHVLCPEYKDSGAILNIS